MLIMENRNPKIREELKAIPVPSAEDVGAGDRWRPVPHHELADVLIDEVQKLGYRIKEESWGCEGPNDEDLIGSIIVEPEAEGLPGAYGDLEDRICPECDGEGYLTDEGYVLEDILRKAGLQTGVEEPGEEGYETECYVCDGEGYLRDQPEIDFGIAIRHSNRMRYALSVAVGGRVTVCWNGMLSAEHVVRRMHTSGLSVRDSIREGLEAWLEDAAKLRETVEALKAIELVERDVAHALIQAGRSGVLAWSAIGKVDREWRRPRHEAFEPRNAWSLYNCFTEIAKQLSASRQLEVMDKARRILLRQDDDEADTAT